MIFYSFSLDNFDQQIGSAMVLTMVRRVVQAQGHVGVGAWAVMWFGWVFHCIFTALIAGPWSIWAVLVGYRGVLVHVLIVVGVLIWWPVFIALGFFQSVLERYQGTK